MSRFYTPPSDGASLTLTSTANAREWWAAESRRIGTDWITLLDAADAALSRLRILHVGVCHARQHLGGAMSPRG